MYIQVAGDTHSRAWIPQFMKKTGLFEEDFPFSCNISKQIFKYKTNHSLKWKPRRAIQEKPYLNSKLFSSFIRSTHTKHFSHLSIFVCQIFHLLYNLEKRQKFLLFNIGLIFLTCRDKTNTNIWDQIWPSKIVPKFWFNRLIWTHGLKRISGWAELVL